MQQPDNISALASEPVERQFLVFRLGREEFGLEILKVQEIRSYDAVTRIPNSPNFVKGVFNLRGAIVPIIDLRMKFNLETTEYGPSTVVIMLNFSSRTIGVIVDGVSDVIGLDADSIQPVPEFSTIFSNEYLIGLATVAQRMIILIDIEKLLTQHEVALPNEITAHVEEAHHV